MTPIANRHSTAVKRSLLHFSTQQVSVKRMRFWSAATVCWLAAVGGLCFWMTDHGLRADHDNLVQAGALWPSSSSLQMASDRPTLVLFLHPMCACSEATVGELENILSTVDAVGCKYPAIWVVASLPADNPETWRNSRLNQRAKELPGATFYADFDGVESARFGVCTSGTVILFDPSGKPLYSGGVTAARGQAGQSVGGIRLTQLLKQQEATGVLLSTGTARPLPATAPAFGCRLCRPRVSSTALGQDILGDEANE